MYTEEIEILPAKWGSFRIFAEVEWTLNVETREGPAVLICFNIRWGGDFGGSKRGLIAPIILEEGEDLQTSTFQLAVDGPSLRNPDITLQACIDGELIGTTWPVRPIEEVTESDCIKVRQDLQNTVRVTPKQGRVFFVEWGRCGSARDTCAVYLNESAEPTCELTPREARTLAEALLFFANRVR